MATKREKYIGGKIAGSKFRYDVPSKCTCVERVFKQELTVDSAAELYQVNPITIKIWIKKFFYSYTQFKKLPKGTMTVADHTVEGVRNIAKAKLMLEKHSTERSNFNAKFSEDNYKKGPKLNNDDYADLTGVSRGYKPE